ncbi:hypothetical protein MPTK1_1g04150 [Marchantia polymorpha subsp. ruderalis]|uniref:Uncharacterized protein n=2 Tax=Marchantia polymorpha TaxID=3197 RepID=A0A176VDA1_MARPO|nr:hypothetical protein AXG93_1923s1130 [Marchantia polymorpha subsp. ruderalis]PTQ48565.1 hypothetical protein MARPO_0005s0192 [Marchantia polymorpha]PTQ48566.1 hypothetical protein MARPO_0005s0192 [Marchantia polymorpha]PTQ48567.1 hypothetical protein MARPO_0005s0192 [Marchantia polymorpha]BBM97241.1 hypothetical protein Mp_1g04150 [Marchantia polymorpha subsp. ruderalis]|eukprot:PTQ48565.1 hypothetical protein MARPO_0005s0192 [Marchantia polymorpha]
MAQQMSLLCTRILILIWLLAIPFDALANLEGDALYAFRQHLNDPEEVLASWDNSLVNPCTWFHVTCNGDNNVIRVDLGNSSLSGSLVPELGNLASLEYLELFNNHISGSIPPELGNLANLASLDLYQNALTGTIPVTLGRLKNLKYLRMDHNILTGAIPTELTYIGSLLVVKLSYNNLTGVIPRFASSVSTFFQGNPYLIH